MKKFGFSWSWKRASGLSAAKGKVSRAVGVPLSKSGRERKVGRAIGVLGWGLLGRRGARIVEAPLGVAGEGMQTCDSCGHIWKPRFGKAHSPRCPNCGVMFTQVTVKRPGSGLLSGCIAALLLLIGLPILFCVGVGTLLERAPNRAAGVGVHPNGAAQTVEHASSPVAIATDGAPGAVNPPSSSSVGNTAAPAVEAPVPPVASEKSARPQRETRTWRDRSGQFSVSARLVGVLMGKVTIAKADGSEVVVPMERLSQEDQDYIRAQMR